MRGLPGNGGAGWAGFFLVLLYSAVSVNANPVSVSEMPVFEPATFIPLILAILAEAICVRMLLRRWRRPARFIPLLILMHIFTYPLFLAVLWLSFGLRPAIGVALGEALIVLTEGGLIYVMCRYVAKAKSELPVPSLARSTLASLVGNIISAGIFPLLIMLYGLVAHSMVSVPLIR